MKRNCEKGKPCGATCIDAREICRVDLKKELSVSQVKGEIQSRSKPYTLSPSAANEQRTDKLAGVASQVKIKSILNGLREEGDYVKVDGNFGEKEIKWDAALSKGITYVGGGDYGSFVTIETEKLLGERKEGIRGLVGVKAGRIGESELEAIKLAGANDLGPKLLGARISSRPELDNGRRTFYTGVVAMTLVPAMAYSRYPEVLGVLGPKSDMYWRGVAALHRLGIAHNDMHGKNVFLNSSGVARFVDFGLAQLSSKAALAEALGSIYETNWQFAASRTEGLAKVARSNFSTVERILRRKGFNQDDIDEIRYTGIRRSLSSFEEGAWGKLSNKDAKELIEVFYKGI